MLPKTESRLFSDSFYGMFELFEVAAILTILGFGLVLGYSQFYPALCPTKKSKHLIKKIIWKHIKKSNISNENKYKNQ